MRIEDEISKWGREIVSKLANLDMSPLFPAIQQIVRSSIIRNFRAGGRFSPEGKFGGGSQLWEPSKRSLEQSGQTLRDKGLLANSITVTVKQIHGQLLITASSNLPYARVHQYGINKMVQVKQHTRTLRKTSKGTVYARGKRGQKLKKKLAEGITIFTVNAHSRLMRLPARPYLVIQNEDIIKIKELIQRRIGDLL